jgi:hypothetical protein
MVSPLPQRGKPSVSSEKEDAEMTAFADPVAQIPRDRWLRPLIIPRDGGEPVAHTRCTTFADALEDKSTLIDWSCRQTAIGLMARDDLRIAVAAHKDDKKEMNSLIKAAQEAAGSKAAATRGTAVHRILELLDMGQEVTDIPAEIQGDIAAYREATRNMRFISAETFVVIDEFRVAGTFDRQVEFEGANYIFDLKTGSSVDYSAGKFGIQLALYSMGEIYDAATGARTPLNVDPDWGIVAHLPVGKGVCTMHWIDLQASKEALQHCAWVREWRKRGKGLLSSISPERLGGVRTDIVQPEVSTLKSTAETPPSSAPTPAANPFTAPNKASLEEWVAAAPTRDILRKLYEANQDTWEEALTRLAQARGNLIDAGMVGADGVAS